MRLHGQMEKGIPILETDIGEDLGDPRDQNDCWYCMVPKVLEDLVSSCGYRGSLQWCHHECLKRWAEMKGRLSCELHGQPHVYALRTKLVNEGIQEEENKIEDLIDQLGKEDRPRGTRRSWAIEEDPEEEPLIIRRWLEERKPPL